MSTVDFMPHPRTKDHWIVGKRIRVIGGTESIDGSWLCDGSVYHEVIPTTGVVDEIVLSPDGPLLWVQWDEPFQAWTVTPSGAIEPLNEWSHSVADPDFCEVIEP
jgi:hypothetical protein